jgi:hypothetical protein
MKANALLSSIIAIQLAACSSSRPEPTTSDRSPSSAQNNEGSGSKADGGASPPPSTSADPPPRACPDLSGKFLGQVTGKMSSTLLGDFDITGTATVILRKESDTDFKAQDGSQLSIQAMGQSQSEPLTGIVKCGVLDMEQDNTQNGVTAHLSAKCTFTASGCRSGTWTVTTSDNSMKGSGTFSAPKAQ